MPRRTERTRGRGSIASLRLSGVGRRRRRRSRGRQLFTRLDLELAEARVAGDARDTAVAQVVLFAELARHVDAEPFIAPERRGQVRLEVVHLDADFSLDDTARGGFDPEATERR